ncbi:hypothetical protein FACS1894145_1640 [Bacteroidia bacterium]|nr:hypothetical protein FACS1894145_1640 [Bacteroidia bacterium]
MKTFKLWLIAFLCLMLWQGCEENEYTYYTTDKPTLYFALPDVQRDSLVISFVKYGDAKVIELPLSVEIAGYSSDKDRHFQVKVVPDSTTAVANKHYRPLESEYTLHAGKFKDEFTVYLLHEDPELDFKPVRLRIEIVENDEFGNGVWQKQAADIRFSNILSKPAIWDIEYVSYFSEYSKTKHQLILRELNLPELPDIWDGEKYKWEAYGLYMNTYFSNNEVYDENGKRIIPWW